MTDIIDAALLICYVSLGYVSGSILRDYMIRKQESE